MDNAPSLPQRIYEMLMESQYWPPEKMLEFQRSQLSQLLRHAKANVPFYNTRLDPIFKEDGEIDWNRWQEIPIVKRHHLVEQRDSMLATQLPPGHGATWEEFSSGSSGTPITTRHIQLEGCVSGAVLHRAQRWHNMDWSKNSVSWRGNDDLLSNWPEGQEVESWAPDWTKANQRGKSYYVNRATSQENVIEYALRKNALYLSSRPKLLQSLALASERLNTPLNLEVVTTFGTGVTDDEREDFHSIFGAKVLSLYSSGEGCKIANTCETGHHYHVNPELNYLEILDDGGSPCAIGQPGRVIITPIYNTAQPLIRYEQGDIAVRGPTCSCGKQLPVLQEISGRVIHLFRFPDGHIVAPSLPTKEFITNFGVKTWQLVQTGPLEVELRYVQTDPNFIPNKTYALDVIRRRVRADLKVTFVALSETPLTEAGKFILYKSELPKSN
jgi:phenylacetate-CoA ligase